MPHRADYSPTSAAASRDAAAILLPSAIRARRVRAAAPEPARDGARTSLPSALRLVPPAGCPSLQSPARFSATLPKSWLPPAATSRPSVRPARFRAAGAVRSDCRAPRLQIAPSFLGCASRTAPFLRGKNAPRPLAFPGQNEFQPEFGRPLLPRCSPDESIRQTVRSFGTLLSVALPASAATIAPPAVASCHRAMIAAVRSIPLERDSFPIANGCARHPIRFRSPRPLSSQILPSTFGTIHRSPSAAVAPIHLRSAGFFPARWRPRSPRLSPRDD